MSRLHIKMQPWHLQSSHSPTAFFSISGLPTITNKSTSNYNLPSQDRFLLSAMVEKILITIVFCLTWSNNDYNQIKKITCTLSFELALSMMYLMEPWMFSVQLTSHVTVLSCRTSFQRWPAGATGTRDSLLIQEVKQGPKASFRVFRQICCLSTCLYFSTAGDTHWKHSRGIPVSHFLTCCSLWWRLPAGSSSSACPVLDARLYLETGPEVRSWSCRCALCGGLADSTQTRPGSSGWPLSTPVKWIKINLNLSVITFLTFMNWKLHTSFSSLLMFFLASTFALCMAWISPKSHLSSSWISDLSSSVISLSDTKH